MRESLGYAALHAAWLTTCLPRALEFARVSHQPVGLTQAVVLRDILARHEKTHFGQKYHFDRIRTPGEYQADVPLADYENLEPLILETAAGEPGRLTADPVTLFEPTSGSTGAVRLIPYTSPLQEAFNRALHPWLLDLFTHHPRLTTGPAYWVVTPRLGAAERTSGGLPIGFQEDAEYFGHWGKALIDRLMAVPSSVGRLADPEAWRFQTLLHLLRTPDLRLISLWNPTFLPTLLRGLATHGDRLVAALEAGYPERGRSLQAVLPDLRNGREDGCGRRLWPNLGMISTWTDAEAAAGLPPLQRWFPGVPLQPKGLLATEGVVTIPMHGAAAPVLAARSAFFEFQEGEEGEGPCRLASEIEPGGRYRVVLTTPGGLYRYRLHDIVEMRGWWRSLPTMAFLGKEALVSDLCGEKLNARHLQGVLDRLLGPAHGAFLAPETAGGLPHYALFLPDWPRLNHSPNEPGEAEEGRQGASRQIRGEAGASVIQDLPMSLEEELSRNPHYRWCREVGQLGPLEVVALPFDAVELARRRLARLESRGTRTGTAKTAVLDRLANWKAGLLDLD